VVVIALAVLASACGDSAKAPAEEIENGYVEAAQQIDVVIADDEWEISKLEVPAGDWAFSVVNTGLAAHGFRIEGNGIVEGSTALGSGETTSYYIRLTPGSYRLYDPFGQQSEGQDFTLVVLKKPA
jgi:Cupredoxin-like domain